MTPIRAESAAGIGRVLAWCAPWLGALSVLAALTLAGAEPGSATSVVGAGSLLVGALLVGLCAATLRAATLSPTRPPLRPDRQPPPPRGPCALALDLPHVPRQPRAPGLG